MVDQETDQNHMDVTILWDWTFFFWSTKKNEKKTGQLVDQEVDQNHMDGTYVFCIVSYVNSAMLVKQAFIWERIFFARIVKAFSGYLRMPKNIAMYTIFNVNVCTYVL